MVKLLILALVSTVLTQESLSAVIYTVNVPDEEYMVPEYEPAPEEDQTVLFYSVDLPLSDSPTIEDKKELLCEKRLEFYQNIIKQYQVILEKHYTELTRLLKYNTNKLNALKEAYHNFQVFTSYALERYVGDLNKIENVSDGTDRRAFCLREIYLFRSMIKDLKTVAQNVKIELINILTAIRVKQNETLKQKIFNDIQKYLFGTDLAKNVILRTRNAMDYTEEVPEGYNSYEWDGIVQSNREPETAIDSDLDYDGLFEDNMDDLIEKQLTDLQTTEEGEAEVTAADLETMTMLTPSEATFGEITDGGADLAETEEAEAVLELIPPILV